MGTRETLFQEHFPAFTEEQSADAFRRYGEVVSFCGRPGLPDLFVAAFATEKEKLGPLALNPVVAFALYRELSTFLKARGAI
ncbi:MAG TPA: hypothetical protein VEU53_04265 [Stellaceae bacterium]|nr:hypothetical protein [Stellaceae bacterium]